MNRQFKITGGRNLRCKGWRQEAILRMLENNLENGEDSERLIIYGGAHRAARSWEDFDRIVSALKNLEELARYDDRFKEHAQQLAAANDATRKAVAKRPNTTEPLLAPRYPAIAGQNLRGFGWDIDTGQSTARGMVFPIGSFGHTGFTGTSLWMDPGSDTYVVLLANSIHTRGSPPMSNLRGEIATAAGHALGL